MAHVYYFRMWQLLAFLTPGVLGTSLPLNEDDMMKSSQMHYSMKTSGSRDGPLVYYDERKLDINHIRSKILSPFILKIFQIYVHMMECSGKETVTSSQHSAKPVSVRRTIVRLVVLT